MTLWCQCVEAGLEEERQQRERQESQRLSEAEARAQALRARADLKAQDRQALQLESSCRAVDRSLGQSSRRLQVRSVDTRGYGCEGEEKGRTNPYPTVLSGHAAGPGAAHQGAAAGQPAAVHPADGHQGHRAASGAWGPTGPREPAGPRRPTRPPGPRPQHR